MMFHLLTREMTVTLEDVYHIFRLLVWGTLVMETRDMIVDVAIQGLVGTRVDYRI